MQKKILLLTENLGPGGAERQLCGLAILLHQRGYKVRVVTYWKTDFTQFYEPLLRDAGVDYELHTELMPKATRALRFAKVARAFKPDVVISFLSGASMAACAAKVCCGYRLIVGERNTNLGLSVADRVRFNCYRIVDAIVPNSVAQGEFISTHYPSLSRKVHPIVNFIDAEKFSPAVQRTENKVFTIVTAARFVPQKNYFKYAEALAMAKERGYQFHCHWYGNQNKADYFNPLVEKVKSLGLDDCVTFHNPSKRIADVYRQADALCLPSIHEGYPNVLCEAMSCGLPVICSNVQEMPRIVTEGENGYLFDPHSVEDIVRAVIRLLETPKDKLLQMGQTNSEQVRTRNTEEVFVNQYINLINTL